MVDPTVVALTMTGLGATAAGTIWLGLSLWKGRCIIPAALASDSWGIPIGCEV